jgi:FMN phosphatase YigB (HAD superfamily)
MPFVSICLFSAEIGVEKPAAPIFQLALSQSGSEPEWPVMIGDRLDDDIRPTRLPSWKTMRVAKVLPGFSCPEMA